MKTREECIEYCRKEALKYDSFIEEHKGDRKYADLIPAWANYADVYKSIILNLTSSRPNMQK